jgi:hypothetical protein
MRTLLSPVVLASLLSFPLAGCSGSAEPPPSRATAAAAKAVSPPAKTARAAPARSIDLDADVAREKDAAQATDFFVWTREGEERTVTHHLDAAGRTVETLDGIVIATSAGTWQWRVEDRSVPTVPCEYADDEGHVFAGAPATPGAATRASLSHLASGAEQIVVDPGVDLMGNADVKHDVGVIASIGPYLFVEESTYAYSCGAHGNTGVSSMIWNAATGMTVAMPTDLGSLEAPRGAAVEGLTDEDDDVFAPTEEDLELTEILPRFARDGSLEVGLQFTAPTCYACTRGGWGSYTKSTVVDAVATPALLTPFASPPPAVRAFLRTHPDFELKGWSAR